MKRNSIHPHQPHPLYKYSHFVAMHPYKTVLSRGEAVVEKVASASAFYRSIRTALHELAPRQQLQQEIQFKKKKRIPCFAAGWMDENNNDNATPISHFIPGCIDPSIHQSIPSALKNSAPLHNFDFQFVVENPNFAICAVFGCLRNDFCALAEYFLYTVPPNQQPIPAHMLRPTKCSLIKSSLCNSPETTIKRKDAYIFIQTP